MEKQKSTVNKFRKQLNIKKPNEIIKEFGYKGDEILTKLYCSK